MKLYFRQRFFSWLDSYDIYDESQNVKYIVKGKLYFGHCFKIYDTSGKVLGTVLEKKLVLLPTFEMYDSKGFVGFIRKRLTLLSNNYNINCKGWYVKGDFLGWNYKILSGSGNIVADIYKELHITDYYVIDVKNDSDALYALMLVLAIDAEKCSKN